MDIKSILNSPSAGSEQVSAHHFSTPVVVAKRQKVPKDAPVFSEGNKTVGHVNYPPHEAGDDRDLEARHREFRIFPLGQIQRKGARHIPYNSDKKDFLEKTGRDAFEVFQYTYKRPGEDKEYVVVWDYNVGLVRMTPFFKSCKYTKTIPAKALRENPGLKNVSYSITGGALVCQGYWMPYQAAKGIAATFCYDIRWALTPVFGNDFPQMCIPPQHPLFARFVIDPHIVSFCMAETARFREEGASYRISQPILPSPALTPLMPVLSSPWKPQNCPGDLESGYGSDAPQNDKTILSPQVSPRSQYRSSHWTPVNGSDSPTSTDTTCSPSVSSPAYAPSPEELVLPTSVPSGYYEDRLRTKRAHSRIAYSDCDAERCESSTQEATITEAGRVKSVDGQTLEAAEALMLMGVVGRDTAVLPTPKRTRREQKC